MENKIPVERPEADQKRLAALREYVDWLEAHIDARVPYRVVSYQSVAPAELVSFARRLGGRWRKEVTGQDFELRRAFGDDLEFDDVVEHVLYTNREKVCKRVVVGVEEVEVEEPDPDAVAALPKVKRVERVEKVEWECPESLSLLGSQAVIV